MIRFQDTEKRTPANVAPKTRDVVVVGCGDVVHKKLAPAIRELTNEKTIGRVNYLDVCDKPAFLDPSESFLRIDPQVSLAGQLLGHGMPTESTLAVICAPTHLHASLAIQLSPICERVAVEKPLTMNMGETDDLRRCGNVFPIGHQLFKQEMLHATARAAEGLLDCRRIRRIDFKMLEPIGIGQRAIDPITWDTAWHGFELMQAPLYAAGMEFTTVVTASRSAVYEAGDCEPTVSTAARIDGFFATPFRMIEFTIRLGKGMGVADKSIQFRGSRGELIHTVSLNESGHAAHRRLMRELLTADEPNMQLNLAQASEVVRCCHEADFKTQGVENYIFGTTPAWLD